MPLSDRNYMRKEHPPACTCADCVNKRLKRLGINPRKHTRSHKKQKSAQRVQPANKHSQTSSRPQSEYHPPTLQLSTDRQTRIKRDYPRHVRIIANIILLLIVIFVIGLLGGGIYGISKYHSNALHWVSQEYHSLANNIVNLKDKTTKSVSDIAHDASDSIQSAKDSAIASISGDINKASTAIQSANSAPQSPTPSASTNPNTTPVIPVTPTPIPSATDKGINNIQNTERLAFDLINSERVKIGLSATLWDDKLYQLSKAHTQEMANQGQLFHSPVNGLIGEDAWGGYGYSRYSGTALAQAIVDSWMSSPLHRAWILHTPIIHSVVSIVSDSNGQYASWTFWTAEAGEGPPLIQRAYQLWQSETGGNIPWLTWLYDIKGYPNNQEFLKQLGIK